MIYIFYNPFRGSTQFLSVNIMLSVKFYSVGEFFQKQ